MSDLEKILLTSAFTILGGVIVFVIGQVVSKFLIEPIQDLGKTIGEVRFNLAFFAPIIHTPIGRDKERSDKAYDAIMKSSCDLLTKADAIPFYRFLPHQCVLPRKHIDRAAIDLRALSTYLHESGERAASHTDDVNARVDRIERELLLRPLG